MVPGYLKTIGRFILDAIVLTLIVGTIPGIPPNVNYASYSLGPSAPFTGIFEPNELLNGAECVTPEIIEGPESIAFRNDEIYTGIIGGHLIRIQHGKIKPILKFGNFCEGKWEEKKCGRPLGMRFDHQGRLIIVDAYNGLFAVDVDARSAIKYLSSDELIDGKASSVMNDVDIGKDGLIYLSVSSTVAPLYESIVELLSSPSGRLLRFDPLTNKTDVLMEDIHFANGVQLSPDEDFVLVSETFRYRIRRLFLSGPRKGESDIFIDGLPGSPDNIRSSGRGTFYVSLVVPRMQNGLIDTEFFSNKPFIRKVITRLTYGLQKTLGFMYYFIPHPWIGQGHYYLLHLEPFARSLYYPLGHVVEVDTNGQVVSSLQGTDQISKLISQASVDGEYIYLGSPYNNCLLRVKRPLRFTLKNILGGNIEVI